MLRRYNDSSPPKATTQASRGRLAAIGISICIVAGGSVAIVANTNVTGTNTTVVVEVHGGGSQVAVNGGTNN